MFKVTTANCFQSSNGRKWDTKIEALNEEFRLSIKALIQSEYPAARSDSFSVAQIADTIMKKSGEVKKLIEELNRGISNCNRYNKPKIVIQPPIEEKTKLELMVAAKTARA